MNLTNQHIQTAYPFILTQTSGVLTDGTGSNVISIQATSSFATTASYAVTTSFALNGGGSGTTLFTASTYPITSSWAVSASHATKSDFLTPFAKVTISSSNNDRLVLGDTSLTNTGIAIIDSTGNEILFDDAAQLGIIIKDSNADEIKMNATGVYVITSNNDVIGLNDNNVSSSNGIFLQDNTGSIIIMNDKNNAGIIMADNSGNTISMSNANITITHPGKNFLVGSIIYDQYGNLTNVNNIIASGNSTANVFSASQAAVGESFHGTSSWSNNSISSSFATSSANGAVAWAYMSYNGTALVSSSYNCNVKRNALGSYFVNFIKQPPNLFYVVNFNGYSGSATAPTMSAGAATGYTSNGFTMSIQTLSAIPSPITDFTTGSFTVFN